MTRPSSQADSAPGAARYRYSSLGEPARPGSALLPDEAALALSFNGLAHSVMMVSPVNMEDFALGFSLSNGLVGSADDVYDLRLSGAGERWQAELEISSRAFWQLKTQRRGLAGTSGCGLCGVEALSQALPDLPDLPPSDLPGLQALSGLRERITEQQRLGHSSGAVHAALFADTTGNILLCREDIGRHNALDKLIGALVSHGMPQGFAIVTSRCSLELIHKAIRARIGTLVCLSAPTSTSVAWARRHGLNLVHLPGRAAPRVYSSSMNAR
jgi:FdhD protein